MATHENTRSTSRRTVLFGAACLPALLLTGAPAPSYPNPPKCIAWATWAGHDRAGQVMTPAELDRRYAGNAKKLRYALRRLARYQAETGRAVS